MEIRISVPNDGRGNVEIHFLDVDEKQNTELLESKLNKPAKKPRRIVKKEPRWNEDKTACPYCGKLLSNPPTGRKKRFCSDECRRKWWNSNRDKINKNPGAQFEITCKCCGKRFISNGNSKRKYCSHDCYVNYRYWEGNRPAREKESSLNMRAPEITLICDNYPEK